MAKPWICGDMLDMEAKRKTRITAMLLFHRPWPGARNWMPDLGTPHRDRFHLVNKSTVLVYAY